MRNGPILAKWFVHYSYDNTLDPIEMSIWPMRIIHCCCFMHRLGALGKNAKHRVSIHLHFAHCVLLRLKKVSALTRMASSVWECGRLFWGRVKVGAVQSADLCSCEHYHTRALLFHTSCSFINNNEWIIPKMKSGKWWKNRRFPPWVICQHLCKEWHFAGAGGKSWSSNNNNNGNRCCLWNILHVIFRCFFKTRFPLFCMEAWVL